MLYTIVNHGDESNVTVILPGQMPLVAHSSYPNYDRIVTKVLADDATGLPELFDVSAAAAEAFERITERVSISNGVVYFDGDEVDNSLTRAIRRFLDSEVEDFMPLVRFMENVASNPQRHSREMLYDWLNAHEFTITEEGHIVGYKGVHTDGEGNLVSGFTGRAIVDGVAHVGHIPNPIGATVEMPRSSVAFDPGTACSTGLHVGTYRYAKGYASGALLEVHVNPRDVVSVPTDARGEKVRVCRYTIVGHIDAEMAQPLRAEDESWDDDDETCLDCYNDEDDCICDLDATEDEPGTEPCEFEVGDMVTDPDHDIGEVIDVIGGYDGWKVTIKYDDDLGFQPITWDADTVEAR